MMRDFFILSYDDRDDLDTVSDYEMDDFDLRVFWRGRPFKGKIPASVRLWVRNGKPSDYLGNPVSWPIVSERLFSKIRPLVQNDIQQIPPPLYCEKTRASVQGYTLMNVTRCLDVIKADSKNAGMSMTNLVLERDRIPADVHVFRIQQSTTVIIVSDAFVTVSMEMHLQGVAFIRTRRK